ncbi:Membrane coat complex Retromer, subunit VPS5/SNX1, Sorting nexins, and related PX domain-containing proteins [Ceraceosorus bombacis]|uniref:Membrane coat complex Retromer, subunit VPS5/SNX1, Sorting nexins, and related PX domain-containing proteins n=1 Tax=Ceraceosorus bombacis TaxID=401625 RepID=A0A0P1B959_9BASI|nr:Membrane coat complex Retromer, subunit VPS5/SNX1, Sorting nexins, and related PX domain-containing proteins [Ceraceosorus bombacis]
MASKTASQAPDAAFEHAGHALDDAQSSRDDSLEGIANRIPRLRDSQDPLKLTPLRAHYLKKTLVQLQAEREIKSLSQKDALSSFGPPFSPSAAVSRADVPILRFLFHHFVVTFPFLRSAPANFWPEKVQVFVTRFLERNISGMTPEEGEVSKRKRLSNKIAKWVTLLVGAAVHVQGVQEEVLTIAPQDRERMAAAQARMKAALAGLASEQAGFDVNVVGVRTVKTKPSRLARSKIHDEFLIRTRRQDFPDVFVSRRYGDFARLADTLKLEFPGEDIGRPPAKDRRGTQFAGTVGGSQFNDGDAVIDNSPQLGGLNLEDIPSHSQPRQRTLSSGAGLSSRAAAHAATRGHGSSDRARDDSEVPPPLPGQITQPFSRPAAASAAPLAREKNRLTLRAYVRSLLAIPSVADSAALSSFLLEDATTLSSAEVEDVAAREALDAVREDEAGRFASEASRRISELREHISAFKSDLVQRDGLTRVFSTIKHTPNIEELPESYRALLSWGRISAASTLFHLFMGTDTSSDLFAQLKRIHGLMPYFMLRGILRISNPVSMIRSVIDLFLAQPFGQRSLLQRMFTSSMQEEVRELERMLMAVKGKIEDEDLCERVKAFVNAPVEYQRALKAQAKTERLDILTCILRSPPAGTAPLTRPQITRVVRASRAYEVYKQYRANLGRGEEDQGPDAVAPDAWLYEDLHIYLRCLTRLRDKEQMISLIFEGVTSELLKDIVTIFYSPLAQVYKAANIADSLSDLQAFINDLIRTVESHEELSYVDPQRTVQVFIDLVGRHEGRFYHFVHEVHSKGSGLFDGLMHWIELFINFVRGPDEEPNGSASAKGERVIDLTTPKAYQQSFQPQQPKGTLTRRGVGQVDLEICMPAGGAERRAALAEIDAIVVHAYRIKMVRELKLRRRLANKEVECAATKLMGAGGGDLGSAASSGFVDDDQAFVAAMVDNLGVGNTFTGEIEEIEAEVEFDDGDSEGGEDEDEDDEEEEQWYESREARRASSETSDSDTAPSSSRTSEDRSALSDAIGRTSRSSNSTTATSVEQPSISAQASKWRPPAPGRSVSQLTARPADKDLPPLPPAPMTSEPSAPDGPSAALTRASKKAKPPRAPELKILPDMVPLFTEMVRPLLRPARSLSSDSLQSPINPSTGSAGSSSRTFSDSLPPHARQTSDSESQQAGWGSSTWGWITGSAPQAPSSEGSRPQSGQRIDAGPEYSSRAPGPASPSRRGEPQAYSRSRESSAPGTQPYVPRARRDPGGGGR